MGRLEDLTKGARLAGVAPIGVVTVIDAEWVGSDAVNLTYEDNSGNVRREIIYRAKEQELSLEGDGRPWSFDADPELFTLVAEAKRISLAHLFDPYLATYTSDVDPLPHQIEAVYTEMLPRRPLRFLLADDPGADNPNLGRFLAARKVARTVYFGSAPSQQAANKGLDDRSIKLGCIQPGEERPAIFGDALRKLSDQASYLYRDGARYWYALQANVNRIARDRAEGHFNDADVDDEIRRRLDEALKAGRGQFAGVHPCPRSPADVPDTDEARLVVLDPTSPHDSKTEQSEALKMAQQTLLERAGGARQHRNMLVFLAADVTRLGELRQAVRNHLAWQSIRDDSESLNLDPPNARQAESKAADADETVASRIPETYIWVLNPSLPPDNPRGEIQWEKARVTASGPLAERVAHKLVHDESLIPVYGGTRLRWELDRVPLWRDNPGQAGDEKVAISVNQLWSDITQYLYLPRLVRRSVLEDAIRDGVQSTVWATDGIAYAEGHDGERYVGLRAGEMLAAIAPSGLLVHPDAANSQIEAEQAARARAMEGDAGGGVTAPVGPETEGNVDPEPTDPAGPTMPTRYYGRVTVKADRWTRTAADIAEAIVNQLAQAEDAKVSVTIEVEATADDGFDDDVRRTITENAATLKFNDSDFES
ncbi:hypothetical protein [Candidatus Poriferisocius sp.]|uniref:hypothetical protein n=1 Tax=Candidatus Poriferisocius sp. TaxID=3101276 RepID=UPI003B0111AE